MPTISLFKDKQLTDLLYKTEGDVAKCAKILGVAKSTIYSRIQRTENAKLKKTYEDTQKKKQKDSNLLNRKFGSRLVIAKGSTSSQGHQFWVCKCECGDVKEIPGSYLLNGRSHKCNECNLRKHGMKDTPEYYAWCSIIQRCCNPNNPEYPNYGGRGITISDEYRDDFMKLFKDIGSRPNANFSIGRIDNEKGYESGNVRWETAEEQTNNRRVTLQVDGENISCTVVSKKLGIDRETVRRMVNLRCSMDEIKAYPTLNWRQKREFFKAKKNSAFSAIPQNFQVEMENLESADA